MSADGELSDGIRLASLGGSPTFFAGATHEEALARLQYLVETGKSCGLVVGPGGTGKSTALRMFADECAADARAALLLDLTDLGAVEILERLAEKLAIAPRSMAQLNVLWRDVTDALTGYRQAGRRCVVIFDHLDRGRADCHQMVRRILAHETSARGATFVLGFSGLSFPIVAKEWRLAADLRIDVMPLGAEETAALVHSLLVELGLPNDAFDSKALEMVHTMTKGVPRSIVRLCELALLSAMHDAQDYVSGDIVAGAMRELSLLRSSA